MEAAMRHCQASIVHILKGIVGFSFVAAIGFSAFAPLAGIEAGAVMKSAVTLAGAIVGGVVGAKS